ncbi:MAG: T9SS type A sorting domain-containing protein [Bacteroidetes bacterium]|nr:T9SS type A sorting domain-containing protein [Bacteroidota bacterium]
MKRNFTIVVSVLFAFALVMLFSSRLISNSVQPPQPPGQGLAGDPGQTTCSHCHAGNTRADATKFTLKLAGDSAGLVGTSNVVSAATQYIPDSTQWVALELNGANGSTPRYGFQITALDSANNLAGTFTLTNLTNTSLESSSQTGRKYVGHKGATATTKAWSFKWKAPHSGAVTFYYTCNMANGDGVEYLPGDSVYSGTAMITAGPEVNVGIAELSEVSALTAYPLPFTHSVTVRMTVDKSADISLSLLSASGTLVKTLYGGYTCAGPFEKSFGLNDVAAGLYMIKVSSGGKEKVIRAFKL